MPLVPTDWNVVIVGHWNRAIFTPVWVSRRLFLLDDKTPVQVLVPMDAVAPHQIKHGDVVVIPSGDKLIVQPMKSTAKQLAAAMEVTSRALDELPRTPITAAGFNLRYKAEKPIGVLQEITTHWWDERISDQGYKVKERAIQRSLIWKNGTINVAITQEENPAFTVLLNFDLQTTDVDQIKAWISVKPEEIENEARRILVKTMGISEEELQHG